MRLLNYFYKPKFYGSSFFVAPSYSKRYEGVANMLRGNQACWTYYEDARRMLSTFRPSQHVNMVWRVGVADMSANKVVRVVFVDLRERHDKRAKKTRSNLFAVAS